MKNYSNQTLIDAFLSRDETKFFTGAEAKWAQCKTTKKFTHMMRFFHPDPLKRQDLEPELMELASKVILELTALHQHKQQQEHEHEHEHEHEPGAQVPKTPLLDGMFPSIESICKPLVDQDAYIITFFKLHEYLARCTYKKLCSDITFKEGVLAHFTPNRLKHINEAILKIASRLKHEFIKIHSAYVDDPSLESHNLSDTPTVQYLRAHYLKNEITFAEKHKTSEDFFRLDLLFKRTDLDQFIRRDVPHLKLMLEAQDPRSNTRTSGL
ncbi:hypothetical protein N9C31_03215 [Gammaproteobacteria bacterium]|nr:hypothetical protein [Gammaproteobacteria bacterium]